MTKIVVFGASGRAGKQIAAVAEERGHEVLRIGRDPGVHRAAEVLAGFRDDLRGDFLGDVVAVSAVADLSLDATDFYTGAARALVASGVGRIIVVGVFPLLEASPGVRMVDLPDFPEENRAFLEGHAAGVRVLAESAADWLVISPVGMFGGTSSGKYRLGTLDPSDELTYEDFALAVVDEIERPTATHTQIGVASVS